MSPDDGPSGSGYDDPVCVAQVTVTGELSATLSAQGRSTSGDDWQAAGITFTASSGGGGGGGGGGGVPAALRGVTRGAGPRQQLLLEGGAAYSARLGGPGPEARQLLDYEARTGRVRLLPIDPIALALTSP